LTSGNHCGVVASAALIVLCLVPAAEPQEWSAALLEQARVADRPVLLVVNDASCAPCADAESAARSNVAIAERIGREFVLIRADATARPDLADVMGLAVRELGGGDGLPLVVALTPDARPYAGRAGSGAFEPAAFDRFASEAVSGFRGARSGLDARADAVADTLRAAQTPAPPLRPLGPDAVDAAVRAVVGWSDLGQAAGPLPHAALRLLLAEHERARRPELLKLVTAALDLRLARRPVDAASTAEEALRLATWTRAFAAAGTASYRAQAARSADGLLAARDAGGLFVERAGDATLVARTSGLAIGALALSARTLGREGDRDAAVRAAGALTERFGAPTALARLGSGPAGSAFLDDYAALIEGLVELYETTDDPRWRTQAQAVADAAIGRFLDPTAGGFFLTDVAHGPLPVRLKHAFDGPLPSANGTLACALPRLSRATGDPRYADVARRTVEAFLGDLQRAPRGQLTLAEGAAAVVGRGTDATVADWSAPARETRGAVTLELRAPQSVRAGETFELVLALTVAPASFVVARSGGAVDLASIGVSVPFEGARQVQPRYPEPQARPFTWSADPVAVYEGAITVPVRVTLPRDVRPSERPVRMRVLFQACTEARCESPGSVTLETRVRIESAR
jgi:uncharacterized protein YyaL (SSP411 family)